MSVVKSVILRGICARDWLVVTVVGFAVFFLYLIAIIVVVTVSPRMADISAERVARDWFFFLFIAVAPFWVITGGIAQRRIRKEAIAGYTTIPYGGDFVDLRDPRTGVLLRAAGADVPPRKMTLSFRRARQAAKVSDEDTFDSHVP